MKPIDAIRLQLKAMEMVEGTELEWFKVLRHKVDKRPACHNMGLFDIEHIELALDIIEGKPVWEDMLPLIAYDCLGNRLTFARKEQFNNVNKPMSWLPPTPKTAMVELLVGDIEWLSNCWRANSCISDITDRVGNACRKTLEELK